MRGVGWEAGWVGVRGGEAPEDRGPGAHDPHDWGLGRFIRAERARRPGPSIRRPAAWTTSPSFEGAQPGSLGRGHVGQLAGRKSATDMSDSAAADVEADSRPAGMPKSDSPSTRRSSQSSRFIPSICSCTDRAAQSMAHELLQPIAPAIVIEDTGSPQRMAQIRPTEQPARLQPSSMQFEGSHIERTHCIPPPSQCLPSIPQDRRLHAPTVRVDAESSGSCSQTIQISGGRFLK